MRKEVKNVIETGDAGKIYEYAVKHSHNLTKEEITALEDAVVEKDEDGFWSYMFVEDIKDVNVEKLQEAVIQKDTTGEWLYMFAVDIEDADIHAIHDKLLELAEENIEAEEWLEWFERDFPEFNNTGRHL